MTKELNQDSTISQQDYNEQPKLTHLLDQEKLKAERKLTHFVDQEKAKAEREINNITAKYFTASLPSLNHILRVVSNSSHFDIISDYIYPEIKKDIAGLEPKEPITEEEKGLIIKEILDVVEDKNENIKEYMLIRQTMTEREIYKDSLSEEYVCSFKKIEADEYDKYVNSYTLRSDSLEEAINKGINFINTEDSGNSIYISSCKFIDEDSKYQYPQIKLTKENNDYVITKESGNIFDVSREALEKKINIIDPDDLKKIKSFEGDLKYEKEGAELKVNEGIDHYFSGVKKSKATPKIYSYDTKSGARTSKQIVGELDKLKPRGIIPFITDKKKEQIAQKVEAVFDRADSRIEEIKENISTIKDEIDQNIKNAKENLRLVNRLEKSMKFTLKEGHEFKLSDLALPTQNTNKKVSFKM